jgi:hypothetical protein
LYAPGRTFAGLPLSGVEFERVPPAYQHVIKKAPPSLAPSFTFSYDCSGPYQCEPQYQIQEYPICARNPHSFGDRSFKPDFRRRGIPVVALEAGPGLAEVEAYSGETTVVIWALTGSYHRSLRAALRALHSLQGVNERRPGGSKLPAPVPGALDGRLRCTRSGASRRPAT